jgi:phenylalanyl-tRNA synthetase beta chain
MKFALSTLKEFLETQASLDEICKTLTKIGLEVENCEDKAKNLADFSVAKIIEAKPHENSNKLKICLVETSDSKVPLQIICGASNARQGIKVAYAPINSIIPSNGMIIKKAKIAGVESNGMLCSASELLINDEDEGIIEIDDKFPIKTKISDVFLRNDAIIEIYATPNRGDCLGVYGIARDLSACGIGKLKNFEKINLKNNFEFNLNINNNASDVCKLIVYRHIKNIKNIESPQWLKEKLTAIDINSINAVVDIANYVMHLTSQPLHCYDISNIKGNISIDLSSTKPEFTSLKNQNLHHLYYSQKINYQIYFYNKKIYLHYQKSSRSILMVATLYHFRKSFYKPQNLCHSNP